MGTSEAMAGPRHTPHPGVTLDELDPDLVALLGEDGPFLTAVLNTRTGVQSSADLLRREWVPYHQQLLAAGAPEELVDQVGAALDGLRLEGPSAFVVAAASGRLVAMAGPEEVDAELAVWEPRPRLATIVRWYQDTPPGLLVVIDRTGADIISGGRTEPVLDSLTEADAHEVHKAQPGGWSQGRYQRRAENRWRASANEVAARLVEHVDQHETRLIVVAGDGRAVQLLTDQLPDRVRDLTRLASGGPGKGSEGDMEDDTRRWYRTAVAEDLVTLLEQFKQELGRHDRAVSGAQATVDALNLAAVSVLLVHDDPADERHAVLPASGLLPLALAPSELAALTGDQRPGRLVDAAMQAAWATGARVAVVPRVPELADDLGAVLRFTT